MKKISAFILTVIMLFALCACGKTDMETEMKFEKTTVESTPWKQQVQRMRYKRVAQWKVYQKILC